MVRPQPGFPGRVSAGAQAWLCLLGLLVLAAVIVPGARAATGGEPVKKVTLCDKEGGPQYVRINVAVEAALDGHAKNHALDIIPPFTYEDHKDDQRVPRPELGQRGPGDLGERLRGSRRPTEPIEIFVDCVTAAGDGSFTARYGYESQNTVERTVPVGAANLMSPGAQDRGQDDPVRPRPGPGGVHGRRRDRAADVVGDIRRAREQCHRDRSVAGLRAASAGRPEHQRVRGVRDQQRGRHLRRDVRIRERGTPPGHHPSRS